MSSDDSLLEAREGATAVLTLNNPARRNALSLVLREALAVALERLETDPAVRAIVLTGADGNFSSGGDLSDRETNDLAAGRARFRLMVKGSKPLIAAVEGWAAGAGVGLALGCDTIVASAEARFVLSFGKVGLIPDFGLLHTLPLRVGQGRARQMMLYGEPVGAAAALEIGLVDRTVPPGTALAAAIDRARLFAGTAPLPVGLTKHFLANGLDAALDWERDIQSSLFLTADHAEGKAAFLAKRAPVFTGK